MRFFHQKNAKTGKASSQLTVNLSRKDLPSIDTIVSRLVNYASLANDTGDCWYHDAYKFCKTAGNYYNLPVETVAALVAILSPSTQWDLNKRYALDALESYHLSGNVGKVGIYNAQRERAQNLLQFGVKSFGQKTETFYQNILLDFSVPTIDSIAAAVAVGVPFVQGTYSISNAAYVTLQSAYILAAKKVGLQPAELQARLWVWARNGRSKGLYSNLAEVCSVVAGKDAETHRLHIERVYHD